MSRCHHPNTAWRLAGVAVAGLVLAAAVGGVVARFARRAEAGSSAGYWLVGTDGGVFTFGRAGFYGSTGDVPLNQPIVGVATTPSGRGYWMVASDGGVFAFGDAGFFGSMGGKALNKPIVAMAPTPSGRGYWMVASDGGLFAFGDAGFFGSMGGKKLNKPVVDIAATPTGRGYWMAASDGGLFAFGDAGFYGSADDIDLAKRIHALAATPSGRGYWMVAGDGGIFAFGDAGFYGSAPGAAEKRVVDMVPSAGGRGYYLTTSNGQVVAYGDAKFHGGTDDLSLNHRIAAMAAMNANEPPVAIEDVVSVDEDLPITIDVLANDRDPEGGDLGISGVSDPGQGSATIASRSIAYRPTPDFNGTDSFTYTVVDDQGTTAAGRVTISVQPVDDKPEAVDDTASVVEGMSASVLVLANDTGLGDGVKGVGISSNPANGTATLEPDGTITYVPKQDFSGEDSLRYRVTDADDDSSEATVSIAVLPVDDVPVAVDDSASTGGGKAITIKVLDNDDPGDGVASIEFTNPDGTPGDVGKITTLGGGEARRDNRTIRYTPPQTPPADEKDSFRYVIVDLDGSISNPATVTVSIGANEAPRATARPETMETPQGTPKELTLFGRDPEGRVTFNVVAPPKNGKLVALDDAPICSGSTRVCGQRYSYTPNNGFTGSDSFTFVAKDESRQESDPVTVDITVTEAASAPGEEKDRAPAEEKNRKGGASTTTTAMGIALVPAAATLRRQRASSASAHPPGTMR